MWVKLTWKGTLWTLLFAVLLQDWAAYRLGWEYPMTVVFGCLFTMPLMFLGRWTVNTIAREVNPSRECAPVTPTASRTMTHPNQSLGHIIEDAVLDCSDPACSVCKIGPLPGEDRQAWLARLRYQYAALPLTPYEIALRLRRGVAP